MKHLRFAAALFAAMPLAACGAGHLMIEQPGRPYAAQAVTLDYQPATGGVPQDAAVYLQERMQSAFFGGSKPAFTRGQDMTVRYRFVGYDAGSRVARYVGGIFGAGEAQMVLEAEFLDRAGAPLGKVRAEGELSGGFFGGSSRSAIDKAVKEIRQYAGAQFKG